MITLKKAIRNFLPRCSHCVALMKLKSFYKNSITDSIIQCILVKKTSLSPSLA